MAEADAAEADAAMAEADAAELDDRMVLDGGCNLPRVPRLDHPECPIDIRYANALCTDNELVTCGAGEHQAPDRWMRGGGVERGRVVVGR